MLSKYLLSTRAWNAACDGLDDSTGERSVNAPPRMSNSMLMRTKMRLTCGAANEAFAAFWARDDLAEVVPAFLVVLQQIMRATVPLLETARDKAAERAVEDDLCKSLEIYYGKHAREEQNHDVWALEDMDAVGYPTDAVLDRVPLPDVAAMMGAQYYWIHHYHPVMLIGCIAVLESGPPTEALIDRLERQTGLGPQAFRTYRFHGAVDPRHLEELDAAVDEMPLTRRDLGLIGISATHTANTLAAIVRRLDAGDAPERRD